MSHAVLFVLLVVLANGYGIKLQKRQQPHVAIHRISIGQLHFYTNSQAEYAEVLKNPSATYEGIVGYMVPSQEDAVSLPIYRLNGANGVGHHMYAGEVERNSLLASGGWLDEGLLGYCSGIPQTGTSAWHRFYNINNCDHLFTANPAEFDNLLTVGKVHGWTYEGVVCYIYNS